MPTLRVIDLDRTKPESCFLLHAARDVYSQNGEDGILEKLFGIIGVENKWCVEFGAWDGVSLSNTCRLLREFEWSGVLIEGNKAKCKKAIENYSENKNVHVLNRIVKLDHGDGTIDEILSSLPIPTEFDFISIDVDGIDYHVWESISKYRPRVVCVEYNPLIPNDVVFIQDRDLNVNQGASLAALVELGKKKGYELAAVTACNGVFVQSNLFPMLGIRNNSIDAMHVNVTGRIFGTFDGTIYNDMSKLVWAGRGRGAELDSFQLLHEDERTYRDRLPEVGA
ncbi:MAG: hypothetical protein AAF546_08480 [Verrucomicrobiota bacterium]